MSENEYNQKKNITIEWFEKSWYNNNQFDSAKYKAYNKYKRLFSALSKLKYGIVLKDDILYLKKVVGGVMIDESKAKTIKKSINMNVLQGKSLNDQLSIIENLFNS
jgi:hypothetical protein